METNSAGQSGARGGGETREAAVLRESELRLALAKCLRVFRIEANAGRYPVCLLEGGEIGGGFQFIIDALEKDYAALDAPQAAPPSQSDADKFAQAWVAIHRRLAEYEGRYEHLRLSGYADLVGDLAYAAVVESRDVMEAPSLYQRDFFERRQAQAAPPRPRRMRSPEGWGNFPGAHVGPHDWMPACDEDPPCVPLEPTEAAPEPGSRPRTGVVLDAEGTVDIMSSLKESLKATAQPTPRPVEPAPELASTKPKCRKCNDAGCYEDVKVPGSTRQCTCEPVGAQPRRWVVEETDLEPESPRWDAQIIVTGKEVFVHVVRELQPGE